MKHKSEKVSSLNDKNIQRFQRDYLGKNNQSPLQSKGGLSVLQSGPAGGRDRRPEYSPLEPLRIPQNIHRNNESQRVIEAIVFNQGKIAHTPTPNLNQI